MKNQIKNRIQALFNKSKKERPIRIVRLQFDWKSYFNGKELV